MIGDMVISFQRGHEESQAGVAALG